VTVVGPTWSMVWSGLLAELADMDLACVRARKDPDHRAAAAVQYRSVCRGPGVLTDVR